MNKKEQFVYESYKDNVLSNAEQFRKQVEKFKLENPMNVYIAITKYQVKKYGETLSIRKYGYDVKEIKQQHKTERQKRYYQKNKNWISEKSKERYKEI